MYKIPSEEGVTKVVVDESVISGETEPLLVYESNEVEQSEPKKKQRAVPDD
jgi:ATP-dependent Clp protease ATP-binding subunit ClpX